MKIKNSSSNLVALMYDFVNHCSTLSISYSVANTHHTHVCNISYHEEYLKLKNVVVVSVWVQQKEHILRLQPCGHQDHFPQWNIRRMEGSSTGHCHPWAKEVIVVGSRLIWCHSILIDLSNTRFIDYLTWRILCVLCTTASKTQTRKTRVVMEVAPWRSLGSLMMTCRLFTPILSLLR